MTLKTKFDDYYDEALLALDASFTVDRLHGEAMPKVGAKKYGDADPYAVMLQICGQRYYGVHVYNTFLWGADVLEFDDTMAYEDGRVLASLQSRGGRYAFRIDSEPTEHPWPLAWSYAAPRQEYNLKSMLRPWPCLAALDVEEWLPAQRVAQLLKDFKTS